MHERVHGYVDAVLDGLKDKDLREAAGQLGGFRDLLARSDDLRAALALPTTAAITRRAIIQDLLSKKVSVPVLSLLSFAAQSGTGTDLLEDAAELAAIAESKAAGMVPGTEGVLGRTSGRQRVSGYATAILAGARDERALGNIEDELFRFMRIVEGNDDLRVALTTNELPIEVRRNLVNDLLARRATEQTRRMAAYVVQVCRPRDYLEQLGALVDQVAAEAKRRVADVRSATEMNEGQRRRLAAALTRLTGTPVDVRVTVQPDLLGGFVATVGDTLVDASLRHRLAQARDLLSAPGSPPGRAQESN